MPTMSLKSAVRSVSLVAVAGLVTTALWLAGGAHPYRSESSPTMRSDDARVWNADYFPNVNVVTHDGRTLRFYDDLIKGKIVVVSFIYTSCSNICPLMTARLAQVKDLIGDRIGRDIHFVSITIDPLVDGPDVLQRYAETYGAGPGWHFVTGLPDDIDLIRRKLGERSRQKEEHRSDIILGNDLTGEWGRDSAFTDIEVLAENIRRMDPAWRAIHREPGGAEMADTAVPLHATPGAALFAKACASCHTIGQGDRVGPDLAGVAQRRDATWLTSFITKPDVMRQRGDALALDLDARYPGVRMPNLGLGPRDAEDVLDFIARHSAATVAATTDAGHLPP